MLVHPSSILQWSVAVKTRPIFAVPVASLGLPGELLTKMLLDTLEGKEPISPLSMICMGEAGDVWQQIPHKLFAKYNAVGVADGWIVYDPKPDNECYCVEVTEDMTNGEQTFQIIGHWGETLADGTEKVQKGSIGDYVLRNKTDPTDVWIVRRSFFNNTYVIKE